uniref:Bifunctional epoxide hydrolase 2 n=1 Tax=Equus caballus TaxID=9796 RepID=A0A9L0R2Y1_HORSE
MALRAAVFDLDGVLALPSIARAFGRAEEDLALPRGFLSEALNLKGPDESIARLVTGEITFSQWVPFIDEDCKKRSKNSGINLPEEFSINQIFAKAISARKINHPMLQAALTLRKKGFTTCILTNNWLDDSSERGTLAQLLCELRPHFDFLIESCRIRMAKPEPQIYKYVLDTLKASPNEVVFLDDIGAYLKPARDLGMVTILVRDTDTALRELEKVTGMQLLKTAAPLPTPCSPNDVSHGYVPIKGISQAVFIGHDWGGMLVWNMALFYPERVRAVASLNTPFMPANPNVSPMEIIKANPVFNYQLYFQEPGVAEAELEQNLSRTFKSFFRTSDEGFLSTSRVCERGGLFVAAPEEPSLSSMVSEEDIQFYVQQFRKSGFRGPLNWYRNVERNWQWGCKGSGRKILIPALMVTAEKDVVLVPEMSKHMEDWIPHLKRGHIKDCGHWTQMEKPTELNQILTEWLETDARDPLVVSKL